MRDTLKKYGTTFTVGLFLVSAISGGFLFFHVSTPLFHGMHEWLSMLLLLPVGLHLWKNWTGFARYFRQKTIALPLAVSLAAAVAFAAPSLTMEGPGGNPMRVAIAALENGTVAEVAPLFDLTPEALAKRLAENGYTVSTADQTLHEIAAASGKSSGPELVAAIAVKG